MITCVECGRTADKEYVNWHKEVEEWYCPDCWISFLRQKMSYQGLGSSWENFFKVIFDLKSGIERSDGKSIGNFLAFLQNLQLQHIERNGLEERIFDTIRRFEIINSHKNIPKLEMTMECIDEIKDIISIKRNIKEENLGVEFARRARIGLEDFFDYCKDNDIPLPHGFNNTFEGIKRFENGSDCENCKGKKEDNEGSYWCHLPGDFPETCPFLPFGCYKWTKKK